jgi:hypothetical protein
MSEAITISIGFTGTQKGMTEKQKTTFEELIRKVSARKDAVCFHHGDCVGADYEAANIVHNLGIPNLIVCHPPINEKSRAFFAFNTIINQAKEYLVRNKDIVNESEVLIGCPKEFKEVRRSGTWSTIRYALKMGKRVYVIYPDGSVYLRVIHKREKLSKES